MAMAKQKTRDRTSEVLIANTEHNGYTILLKFKGKAGNHPDRDQVVIENYELLRGESVRFNVAAEGSELLVQTSILVGVRTTTICMFVLQNHRPAIIQALTR